MNEPCRGRAEPSSTGRRHTWELMEDYEGLAIREGTSWKRAGPSDTLSKRESGRIGFTELNLFFQD